MQPKDQSKNTQRKRKNDKEKCEHKRKRSKQEKKTIHEEESEEQEDMEMGDDSSERLLVKRKPQFLVEAIENLNEAQTEAVKSLGFEHVLKFNVEYIPSRFAHSLLKSFNPETCSIKLRNGKEIYFSEEDVQLTFGFPQGETVYHRIERESHAGFMKELAEYGKMKQGNVSHKRVTDLMLPYVGR